ncbi:hypothetical protein DFH28DRAFT_878639, partial [Melampsora americana]
KPCWMVCKGVNDSKTHHLMYGFRFKNEPMEPHAWTNLINAFVHYTYTLSDHWSLISILDCDKHRQIPNVECFVKKYVTYSPVEQDLKQTETCLQPCRSPLYHSSNNPEMVDK